MTEILCDLQVRLAWVSAAVVLAARSTEFLPTQAAAFLHVAAWGLWLGSNIWTTFIAGQWPCHEPSTHKLLKLYLRFFHSAMVRDLS